MSQTTLTSFFQARKHSLPEQQAAKKRKIVLEQQDIHKLLDEEDENASSEEEDFQECEELQDHDEILKSDSPQSSNKDEFEDCVEHVVLESSSSKNIIENAPENSENLFSSETDDVDDNIPLFVEDGEWETLANETLKSGDLQLAECVTEQNLQDTNKEKEEKVTSREEVVSSVVTSATDNHTTLMRSELDHDILDTETANTPSTGSKNLNFRRSKKDDKDDPWTPKSASKPLFTIGCSGETHYARKKLNLGSSKKVVFQKLGSLSPLKKIQVGKFNSPRKVNYENLSLRLTPQKIFQSPGRKPGYSKNLFSTPEKESPPEKRYTPAKPARPELGVAIQQAKSLQSKLTPAEIKAKLGKVKLSDLKSRLASISNSSLKAAEAKAVTSALPPKITSITLQLDLPSPSKRVPPSPYKSPYRASPRKVPAYQRFHNLARPADRTLPLPFNYRFLSEVFKCTDMVVSMLNNRKEIINLEKVGKGVTDLLRKKWNIKYFKQIMCVFPQAYKLAWERIDGRYGKQTEQLELQIRPNMAYKRDLLEELEGRMDNYSKMLPEHLVERRDIFRNSLVEMVKDHHEEFLASLDPPIVADRNALTSWHKDYDTESAPEVDTAELPEDPGKIKTASDAVEVIGKAIDLVGVNQKLSDALFEISNKIPPAPLSSNSIQAGLQGLNPALIAKIKAKEAAKAKMLMTRNPDQVKRIAKLKKLPELARMIRNLFITEKKAALEVQFASKKLTSCMPYGTDKSEVEDHLRYLTVESKGWLKVHLVGKAEYFKMDKTDINLVCKKLERKLQEAEEN